MLERVQISNFALIEQFSFEPKSGLNILTGETGAGKSLIIDAILALQGGRVSRSVVRTGMKKAVIDGVFSDSEGLFSDEDWEESGVEREEDGALFLSREILADGKSVCRINGKVVPVSVLRQFGSRLVDVHGQHDQQAIFSPSMHLPLLDRLCAAELASVLEEYTGLLASYKVYIEEMKSLGTAPELRNRRVELLSYQINEIRDAAWAEGEESLLREQRQLVQSREKIRSQLSLCISLMGDDAGTIPALLSQCTASLREIASLNTELNSLLEQAENAYYILESLGDDLEKSLELYGESTLSLEEIDERIHLFTKLMTKYGNSRAEVLAYQEKAEAELSMLQNSEKRLEVLNTERGRLEKRLLLAADRLHEIRARRAEELSVDIVVQLCDLGMKDASFSVSFAKRPKERFFSRAGYDEAEFLFSANKGEPERPLSKIASGGEASRIMLEIKTILSAVDETPVLIFDEIDTGISGKAAMVVAEKLRLIAASHQALCVTHMAQIAAAADAHFFIDKSTVDERTYTTLCELDGNARVEEVARLLSGDSSGENSLSLAAELIDRAK